MAEFSEKDKKIIDKVQFYKFNELVAHVLIIPKGSFRNGRFVSELEQEKYFWFIEEDVGIPIRLFLSEIWDIEEYQKKGERGK